MDPSDADLVERSRQGDLSAFNQIVARYQSLVFNLAARILGDRSTAEDVSQEAFIAAHRALGGFRGGSLRSWLLRIASNLSYDYLRAAGRRREQSLDASLLNPGFAEPAAKDSPEQRVITQELGAEIQRGILSLPLDQRTALVMIDVQGLTYQEAADATGELLGTVKSRLSRASAAYNGHFGCVCYHPIFVFNQFGDCEGAMLRPGNVHSAHDWREVLEPIMARYERTGVRRYFRADAAFAKPEVYEYLEERRVLYAIRLPSNEVLQWEIAPLLRRPVGRPPRKPIIWYDDFWYQAGSWDRPRRVVAKVEWHQGELFPRVGFIVTNMSAGPEGVVHFYNGRGTAEQWIKEGKYALNWTRLSCHRFVANQVRLQLFILAYNLGNFLRRLCLPKAVKHWSLRSVQIKLIKIGARLVRHARRLVFQLAEVAVSREMFRQVLERIGGLHPAPG